MSSKEDKSKKGEISNNKLILYNLDILCLYASFSYTHYCLQKTLFNKFKYSAKRNKFFKDCMMINM